jgi:hypothetical protein
MPAKAGISLPSSGGEGRKEGRKEERFQLALE